MPSVSRVKQSDTLIFLYCLTDDDEDTTLLLIVGSRNKHCFEMTVRAADQTVDKIIGTDVSLISSSYLLTRAGVVCVLSSIMP
jgi:hypothetical protein